MQYLQLYGMTGVSNVMPLPIQAQRAPTVLDGDAVIGQEWQDGSTGDMYIYGGPVAGQNIWKAVGANAGGIFTAIDVTTGPNIINGATGINDGHNSDTSINTGTSTGNVHIADGTGTGTVTIGNANTPSVNILNNITAAARSTNIAAAGNTAAFADTVNIGSGIMNNAGGTMSTNINTGALTTGNKFVNINTGAIAAGVLTTNIGSGNRAGGTHTTNIATGSGAKTVNVGNADGLTNIKMIAFKATADAGATADAAFTANAGLVACVISNLNTASAASGTITVTNSTIQVGSSVFVNFALAGAEDATMTIDKIRIQANTATITYTNNGAAAIASDCYMSLMVIS